VLFGGISAVAVLLLRQTRHGWLPEYFCRIGTEPSAVAPGQTQETRPKIDFDPALPRSVLCLPGEFEERTSSWHGRCEMRGGFKVLERKIIMKTVVSFLLGAVMLFGAATLGLPSASANAKDRHDKNYSRHHRRHHRRHYRHRKNHLSY
jgi:hypothetical protein